jgi:hypothetical protein
MTYVEQTIGIERHLFVLIGSGLLSLAGCVLIIYIYYIYIYNFCIYIHTLFQILLLGGSFRGFPPPWCGNGVRLVDLDLPGFEALGTTNTQSGSPVESGVDHPAMNREIMVS